MISKLKDSFIPYEEYVTGTRLRERLQKEENVGYFKHEHLTPAKAKQYTVLVTGHSDYLCDENYFYTHIHSKIKKWFAQNVTFENERLEGIPIGLPGAETALIGEIIKIFQKGQTTKKISNLVYACWRDETYFQLRRFIKLLYQEKDWVTVHPVERTTNGYNRYLDGLYNHKFVLAPRGNAPTSHRMWEALMLRTIPIVERNHHMSYFEDLPILWIDDWAIDILDEAFLEEKYEEIMEKEYNLEKLTLSYWTDKILKCTE